jgi:hypothetical protein
MTRLNGGNKYHAKRTWSILCQREFDSRAEAIYGEELFLLQKAGEIEDLEYQVVYELCDKPKVTIRPDFRYVIRDSGNIPRLHVEDVKGKMTEVFRIKLAWLNKQCGIKVKIIQA